MLEIFQSRLREERRRVGFTQADIAERLGMKQPTYAAIEKGDHDPRLSTIRRIADVLGIDAADLITEKVPA